MDTPYYAMALYKTVSIFLITSLWIIIPPQSNTSGLCFYPPTGALSKSFPLFQLPPVSFSSSSFMVFIFYVVFGGSCSKRVSLWHKNPFSVCLFHFPFCSLICIANGFFCPCLHCSSFAIMLNKEVSIISLKYLFINACRFLVILWVTLHVFHPYRRTDLTLLLTILSFVAIGTSLAFHTLLVEQKITCLLNPYIYTFLCPTSSYYHTALTSII